MRTIPLQPIDKSELDRTEKQTKKATATALSKSGHETSEIGQCSQVQNMKRQ